MLFRLVTENGKEVLGPVPMDYLPNPDSVFDLDAGSFAVVHVPPRIRQEMIMHSPAPLRRWVTTLTVRPASSTAQEAPAVAAAVKELDDPIPASVVNDIASWKEEAAALSRADKPGKKKAKK